MARLPRLRWMRWELDHVRRWHPVPLFYAWVGGVALVPGLVGAALLRRRWLAAATPIAAVVGTFLLSWRVLLEPQGREAVRRVVDPEGAHRRRVEQEIAAVRAAGHRVPILLPASWEGPVRLANVAVCSGLPEPGLQRLVVLAEMADDRPQAPRLRILVTRRADAMSEEELAADVATAESPADDHPPGSPRFGTPVGHGAADIEVFRMPDPSWERVAELRDAWRDTTLEIDEQPLHGRLLVGRGRQVVTAIFDDHAIQITGHGVDLDGLALCRATDPDPLLADYAAAAGLA